MTSTQNTLGCIAKVDYGNAHQLQLWLEHGANGLVWKVSNAYVPGGKFVRSCVLDNGSGTDYADTRRLGEAAFDRIKAEELAKFAPAPAALEPVS